MNAPPSTEQLLHEMRAWTTTPIGQLVIATGVPLALAESMLRHCPNINEKALGEVLVRLASHLAGTVTDIPDMPPWMLTNLIGAAGTDLIDKGQARG